MRTPIVLFALAALVRGALVLAYPDPAYPDSYYYVNVAQQLLAGHGFSIDFIWVFADVGGTLPADPTLPIPSNAHWMPLASLVQVPFLAVLGNSPVVALLPFILIGSLTAPLTWALARDVGAPRAVQIGAGVLGAIPAASTVFFGQPDNFAIYQPLGMAALWMAARGLKGDARAFALGGLLVGLATLARNDGILLGVTLAIAFGWDRWKAWRSAGSRRPSIPAWAAVACLGLFALVMAPWYARQLAEFGSISPSSSSGRILWVRTFEEMNSVASPATLATFLGQGLGPLIQSRLLGLAAAIGNFIVICCSVFLAPFLVIGAWQRRRSVDFGPYFVYAALLFGANGLLFAVHVPYGTFLHSAVALEPGAYILALEGVVAAVTWVAARRTSWNVDQAVPIFVGSAVGLAVITAVLAGVAVQAGWGVERDQRRQVAAELDRLGASLTDRLMTIDSGGYRYYTGRGGVVSVNDPIETIEQVARAYGIRWLVVERAHTVPALAAVLKGETHPDWIGQPALVIPGRGGSGTAAPGAIPAVALYPVCFEPADDRCARTAAGAGSPAMNRREAWFTAIGLFALAAVVRAIAAAAIPFPIPEDTAYYYDVARNVVEGHGLVADALWSFQTPARDPATGALGLFVPRPAFEVWLPLPTLLAILPMSLFGTSYGASLVVQVLVASLVPVLAWRIAADVAEELDLPRGRARSLALGTGILAAIFGPLVLHGAMLDSTAPFAACALAACLLMVRLVRTAPRSLLDLRLVGLGAVLALAAYTRNEVAWLALTWVLVAWFMARDASGARATRSDRLRLILVPAAVAVALFSPWLVRNWLVFGNPLPGQAVANAFSIAGFDIFAWADPPTFARYLAAGPATWVTHRVTALEHNLVTVLLIPAIPVGPVGLVALPWTGRARALRPLLVLSLLTFAITTLFFPVATTWGTFLHAAGPVHVLLLISCLLAFDRVIVKVGAMRGWTRPVAWLGPAFVGFMAVLVVVLTVTSYGALARQVSTRYEELAGKLQAAGAPLAPGEPIVANHPIWMAAVARVATLALPDETPTDVVDLARTFGARILVIDGNEHGSWPGILDKGGPDADCFHAIEIEFNDPTRAQGRARLQD